MRYDISTSRLEVFLLVWRTVLEGIKREEIQNAVRDSQYHDDRWSCCIIVKAFERNSFLLSALLYPVFYRDLGSQIKRKLEQEPKDDDRG